MCFFTSAPFLYLELTRHATTPVRGHATRSAKARGSLDTGERYLAMAHLIFSLPVNQDHILFQTSMKPLCLVFRMYQENINPLVHSDCAVLRHCEG